MIYLWQVVWEIPADANCSSWMAVLPDIALLSREMLSLKHVSVCAVQ